MSSIRRYVNKRNRECRRIKAHPSISESIHWAILRAYDSGYSSCKCRSRESLSFKKFEMVWVQFFGRAKTKSELKSFFNFAKALGLGK